MKAKHTQRIYYNSIDASQFKGPEDIFYVVDKLGSGIWVCGQSGLKQKVGLCECHTRAEECLLSLLPQKNLFQLVRMTLVNG